MKKNLFLMMLVLIFFSSCESTQVTSVVDPFYKGKIIKKLLIFGKINDLNTRAFIETRFSENFPYYDVMIIKSSELLPPTRDYTIEELKQIFQMNKIDAILIMSIEDLTETKEQVTIYQPYQTRGNVYKSGTNQYQYNATTYGGPTFFNNKRILLNMKADLIDPINDKTMWMSSSSGEARNFNAALMNYADNVMSKLETDGFIIRK